jgi:alpha-glucosidase
MTRYGAFALMLFLLTAPQHTAAEQPSPRRAVVTSLDGRNAITVESVGADGEQLRFTITRAGSTLIGPSPIGPKLSAAGAIGEHARIVGVHPSEVNESFDLPWGKTRTVVNHGTAAVVDLESGDHLKWQLELRAYDDGVAFRYVLPAESGLTEVEVADEATRFDVVGDPMALFNNLKNFTTSHEAVYKRRPVSEIPVGQLMDMPLLLVWPDGNAAAITEARVRNFAGMYLERPTKESHGFACRLAPLPGHASVCVAGKAPVESPWRVMLLGESAGKLLESNLLLCLNDPPQGDFSWALPGKTSFHWWAGEFEDDYKLPHETQVFVERHKRYIDFCAANNIAYHGLSGDGRAWYPQSSKSYGTASADADVRVARRELDLPAILDYAKSKGVGIRLWVHWKPLSEHLEEAFAQYQKWGVKGLMVDFLDRDDQQMLEFTDRMMESAARHKLHIQIHGSSKYSGEQRTYPNLFNREGVLNLEYLKWSNLCTPQHSVDVAYTRALAGPVDFHLGGFRSVSSAEFRPQDRNPVVMGTRCHMLALYVVYENPMPMVADKPSAYEGQPGFEFLREVPTSWDETRFVAGEPGEFIVMARRHGHDWYLGGITNDKKREIELPLSFLPPGEFITQLFSDGTLDESLPNAVKIASSPVKRTQMLPVVFAPDGGFVAIVRPK